MLRNEYSERIGILAAWFAEVRRFRFFFVAGGIGGRRWNLTCEKGCRGGSPTFDFWARSR